MKKLTIIFIIANMLLLAVYATPGYEPGISGDITTNKDEYKYSETVFLSGEPVRMEGTVEIKESSNGGKTTVEYTLANTAKKATLDRKVIFQNTSSSDATGKQTTYSTTLDPKYSEEITIGSNTYELSEYLFSRSGSKDDRDIIKYLNSDWNGRKVYSVNDGKGEIVVDVTSHQYGYNNYWSSTETATIKHMITYRYKKSSNASTFSEDYGSVEYAISNSALKTIQYVTSGPLDMSYAGGYILKDSQENVASYIYDIPKLSGIVPTGTRNKSKDSYQLDTVPVQTRLLSNNIKDIYSSYWAAEDIKKVTALGIIDMSGIDYFRPLSFVSRGEFAKAVIKVSDMGGTAVKKTKYSSFEQYYT
ncbi:MAG TPA: S-layer homology domain-containing protein, partial [Negativicutes bacterium]|nr:S-layer homology domain-containing protein [Negativicutes bacterium]